jgi:glycolate oxidase iron-sulfur subunit
MQTAIPEARSRDREVRIAEGILRKCVHCGFCNATCPTYPVLGSEFEGPRGRIYLIKSVLEERIAWSPEVVRHLDNCLSCFACETTCPSGVRYSHLIDPARALIEQEYRRPPAERMQRRMLAWLLPHPRRFRWAMRLAGWVRPLAPLLPGPLGANLKLAPRRLPPPARVAVPGVIPALGPRRARVTLLTGCAQEVLGGALNDATVRVLTRLGCEVTLPPDACCCGALIYHMGDRRAGLPLIRAAVQRWHRMLEGGTDWIVINTSGCGTVVKDYGHILADEPALAAQAQAVAERAKDFSEIVQMLGLPQIPAPDRAGGVPRLRVAYHDACSLQHAQRLRSGPRALLSAAGFDVVEPPDAHLCCGSAGTYNLLQPRMAETLGRAKAAALDQTRPDVIAAGNIGCLEQIGHYSGVPLVHTAELLDWALGGPQPPALAKRL